MPPGPTLHFAIENTKEDQHGNRVTTIICHGKVVSETVPEFKERIKPLILLGGCIVVDLGDVSHLDSAGLGALISLKASAINQGYCTLEFVNMTPRVLELLKITNLTQLFKT